MVDSTPVAAASTKAAFAGEVGKEVAVVLLENPEAEHGVRELARQVERAPSTVSVALERLRAEGLVTSANEPVVPELFWELVAAWRYETIPLAGLPRPGEGSLNKQLRLGFGHGSAGQGWQLDLVGWALTDTVAANAWGMPVVASSGYPPDFYVPSRLVLDRAIAAFGRSETVAERKCTVAVPPAGIACRARVDRPSTEWPTAPWIVVAIDLARDHSRGREILGRWTPPAPDRDLPRGVCAGRRATPGWRPASTGRGCRAGDGVDRSLTGTSLAPFAGDDPIPTYCVLVVPFRCLGTDRSVSILVAPAATRRGPRSPGGRESL